MKKIVIFLALLSVAVLLYGISQTDTFRQSIEVGKNTKLDLENKNGSVKINGWDKDYVDLTVTKITSKGIEELDKVDIVIKQEKNLTIKTEHLTKNPKVSVNYELSVPRSLILQNIESSNGSIYIEDSGDVEIVHTSNGAISLKKCEGKIDLTTSNGSITANSIDGSVIAYTSNGKIKLENINGITKAQTSNGSIQIYNVAGIQSVKTSNGSIQAHLKKLYDDVDISTSNGSISVYLDEEIDAQIDASTSNGKIQLHDFPVMTKSISGSYVAGMIGDGGNLLTLRTSNASIHIYSDDKIEF